MAQRQVIPQQAQLESDHPKSKSTTAKVEASEESDQTSGNRATDKSSASAASREPTLNVLEALWRDGAKQESLVAARNELFELQQQVSDNHENLQRQIDAQFQMLKAALDDVLLNAFPVLSRELVKHFATHFEEKGLNKDSAEPNHLVDGAGVAAERAPFAQSEEPESHSARDTAPTSHSQQLPSETTSGRSGAMNDVQAIQIETLREAHVPQDSTCGSLVNACATTWKASAQNHQALGESTLQNNDACKLRALGAEMTPSKGPEMDIPGHLALSTEAVSTDASCSRCASKLSSGAIFCSKCGQRRWRNGQELQGSDCLDYDGNWMALFWEVFGEAPMPSEESEQPSLLKSASCLQGAFLAVFSEESLHEEVHFCYLGRNCVGKPLHLACLGKNKELLTRLLDMSADVHEKCTSEGWDHYCKMLPIHIAAGMGNDRIVQMLLDHDADVNAKADFDDKPHFTALHECTYFYHHGVAEVLIANKAEVDIKDSIYATPLHVAARRGADTIVELLVNKSADINERSPLPKKFYYTEEALREESHEVLGRRPFVWALAYGRLQPQILSFLTAKTIRDLLLATKLESPSKAFSMLVDEQNKLRDGWVESLRKDCLVDGYQTTKIWIELLGRAPHLAEAILEAVTVEPSSTMSLPDPMPVRAHIRKGMNVVYMNKSLWDGTEELEKKLFPIPTRLEKKFSCNTEWSLVETKVVMLPGVVSRHLLYALVTTDHLRIFAKVGVQAIIEKVWDSVGHRFFYCDMICRLIEILVYLCVYIVEQHPTFEGRDALCRCTWGLVTVGAYRELIYELNEVFQLFRIHPTPQVAADIFKVRSLLDWFGNGLAQRLVLSTKSNYILAAQPEVMSILVLVRWAQLLNVMKGTESLGQKLSSMWKSVVSMGNILFVTLLVFLAFLHACMVLELNQTKTELWSVILGCFRLLLIGDGDGVDTILALNDSDPVLGSLVTRSFMMLAVVIFCVIILGVFQTVNIEAYEEAQKVASAHLVQDRASICLEAMLRVRMHDWTGYSLMVPYKWSLPIWSLSQLTGFAIFLLLLLLTDVHPVYPSLLVLYPIMLMGDAVLISHHWNDDSKNPASSTRKTSPAGAEVTPFKSITSAYDSPVPSRTTERFIWVCHRSDFNEADYYPFPLKDIEPSSQPITKSQVESENEQVRADPSRKSIRRASELLLQSMKSPNEKK
mmetsp:Transcript_103576/g.195001  ORF Transcript_103576/g.195001 Transcript_103576/m.195001 type:complete len:1189 (-) Transcript_103576:198-3764(-)